MKDTAIKLCTGLIAKLIRHILTAAGGTVVATSGIDGGAALNVEQLAAGAATLVVSWGWSVWEDRVKKRQAAADCLAEPFPPADTTPEVQPKPKEMKL
jgi:hypothetical protein